MSSIRPFASRLVASCLIVAGCALALPAAAQLNRTWVSSTGSDVGDCSRGTPCATFAGALAKTNVNGEIDCVDSGGFSTMTITKSVIIDCRGVLGGVLGGGGAAILVNAPSASVTLRGLAVDNLGIGAQGIYVQSVGRLHIEDTIVRASTTTGIYIATGATAHVTLKSVVVRDNGQHGIWVQPLGGSTVRVSIADSTLAGNGATGLRVDDNGVVAMVDSVTTGNGTHGVTASSVSGGPAKIFLERVTSSSNANGGVLANGAGAEIYLSGVVTTGNSYGLYPPLGGGRYFSYGNNKSHGNSLADTAATTPVAPY